MNDITVIGLGMMGSAFACSLLAGGYQVTVWNRTARKAQPLIEKGAVLAKDPASAVEASPIFIVCLLNYEVTHSILSEPQVKQHLPGKVMIQLSGGTPQEAVESVHWAHCNGLQYLSGEIMVYPQKIGTQAGEILVAGESSVYQRCESLLKILAGKITYLGEQVGAPLAYGWAMGSILFGALLGALHGVRICEVEGIDINHFASRLADEDMVTVNSAIQDLLKRVREGIFDESQGTISMAADGADHLLAHANQRGLHTAFPEFTAQSFSQAVKAGLGGEDVAALIKILRGDS